MGRAFVTLLTLMILCMAGEPALSGWTVVNLNPAGATQSYICGVSSGQQAGYARFGGLDGSDHAGLWSGTADSWVDLHALLNSSASSSRAQGVETSAGETWVVGYAGGQAILWHYTPDEPTITILVAKLRPDSPTESFTLSGKVVTYAATDFFYIEEDGRNMGIRVEKTAHGLAG
jgi:hypothetical protein